MRPNRSRPLDSSPLPPDRITEFQSRLGSLRYLADRTRPEFRFPLRELAVHGHSPTEFDWDNIQYFLEHLASTPHLGLLFHSPEGVVLYAHADISYASMPNFRSFTSGGISVGRHSASFQSICSPQSVMADSTTVAEFIGFATVGKEVVAARMFCAAIGFPQFKPTILYQDNKSTIKIIGNKMTGTKTKHIAVRYQLIKEFVKDLELVPEYLQTSDMMADLNNKLHGPTSHIHLRNLYLGYNNSVDPTQWIPSNELV